MHAAQIDLIQKRQEAAKELSGNIFSLQQFRSYSIASPITISSEKNVIKWLHHENLTGRQAGESG
jgi:hypothetical protein